MAFSRISRFSAPSFPSSTRYETAINPLCEDTFSVLPLILPTTAPETICIASYSEVIEFELIALIRAFSATEIPYSPAFVITLSFMVVTFVPSPLQEIADFLSEESVFPDISETSLPPETVTASNSPVVSNKLSLIAHEVGFSSVVPATVLSPELLKAEVT